MSLRDPSPTFHLYTPMTLESDGLAGESRAQFSYQPSLGGQYLQKLPGLCPRRLIRWRDASCKFLNDSTLYIPTLSSKAPFDAFFIDYDSAGSPVLWLIWMTVQPTCGGSAQDSQAVANLTEKIKRERNCTVQVKFLLVVPHEVVETASAITWNLAKMPPGEVFLQSLSTRCVSKISSE